MIIGTVSLAGRAPAFFSAAARRVSRLSCESTRRPVAMDVPYFSAWIKVVARDFAASRPVRSAKFS